MKIESREYKLRDFIKIPFAISPGLASLRVVDKIIYALIPALQVLATASFIDTAIGIFNGQTRESQIIVPLVCILLLIAHQYITFALMGLVRAKIDIKLTEAFRTVVTEKRAMLEYRHVENNDSWDIIERVGKDPAVRLSGGFDILLRMGDMVIRISSVLFILIAQVWWVALVIMCFSVPLLLLAVKSGKAHYNASKEAANHTRRAQYLQGVLTGRDNTEERSLFGYADALNYRYYEKYLAAYKINMKAQRKRYIRVKTASLITLLLSALIAGVLIAPLGSGEISIGMFMGFVTATFGLVQMLSWELTYITSELASHREYLRDLTLFANFSETPGAVDMPVSQGIEPQCIEFCNVSFAYPGCMGEQDTKCPTSPGCMGEQDTKCPTSPGRMGEQDTKCPTSPGTNGLILKNLSLKLYAKKHYAFVGVNGAGKTTITKLLTGLYDNYTGDILIDGKNLRDFSQAELKAMFAIVYQDFAKYQIRLLDSIGIGNINGVSEQNIASTIKTLGLADMVSKLPEGTQTPLGKIKGNGVDLSGGEWQRIAIARSLISSAPIHILDEPTAALDPAAESELYELFAKISKGKSTIFITHRLGAARLADEIFVIADGHVAEQGAHDKLISKNGMYAEMFEAQRGWYG